MSIFERISIEEFKKAKNNNNRGIYTKIYEEMNSLKENECMKKVCENNNRANTICVRMHSILKDKNDDRFTVFKRQNVVFIARINKTEAAEE